MNTFNDNQYDLVCDENEFMRKHIERLKAIVKDRNEAIAVFQDVVERNNTDLGLLRAELAAAKAEIDNLRSSMINVYPDLHKELDEAKAAARFVWSCGRHRMWQRYCEEAMKKWPWMDSDEDSP